MSREVCSRVEINPHLVKCVFVGEQLFVRKELILRFQSSWNAL